MVDVRKKDGSYRPQSTNVEDLRNYFGSDALDTDYPDEDRKADFVKDSLMAPYLTGKPQKFKKRSTQDIIEQDSLNAPLKKYGMSLTTIPGH